MYSTCFSTKMLLAKLAQMGNFCLAKSDAMWSMAQMTTGSASLANDGDDSVSDTTSFGRVSVRCCSCMDINYSVYHTVLLIFASSSKLIGLKPSVFAILFTCIKTATNAHVFYMFFNENATGQIGSNGKLLFSNI